MTTLSPPSTSLRRLYKCDWKLHDAALDYARQWEGMETLTDYGTLAEAYLDLRLKRGLPPTLAFEPTIQLASGKFFNFLDPAKTPLTPVDIAEGLSKVNRCAGHTRGDFGETVAQHCVLASRVAPAEFKFEALMHDAVESVMGDCPTPLKMCMPDWRAIEQHCEHSVRKSYHLPLELSPEVKLIDIRLAATEKRDLMSNRPGEEWAMLRNVEPYDFIIEPWPAPIAKERWLEAHELLSVERFVQRTAVARIFSGSWHEHFRPMHRQ